MQNRLITWLLLSSLMVGCSSLPIEQTTEVTETTVVESEVVQTKEQDVTLGAVRPRFNSKAEQLFKMANGLRVKDSAKALALYQSAIAADSSMEPAYYNQARLNLEQKSDAGVASVMDLATQNSIQSARLNNLYATVLRQQGQFNQAKEYYMKALMLDSNYGPALVNLAILSDIYLQDLNTAKEYYLKYQATVPADSVEANQVKNWLADLNLRIRKQAGGGS